LNETNSGSISFVHRTGVKDNQAILPSLEFLKVVNNFLGTKIFVLQNTLSVVVSQENDFGPIDSDDMMLFKDNVEYKLTLFVFDFSDVSWVLPNVVNHDWVAWCYFKTIAQSAKIYSTSLVEHLYQASN